MGKKADSMIHFDEVANEPLSLSHLAAAFQLLAGTHRSIYLILQFFLVEVHSCTMYIFLFKRPVLKVYMISGLYGFLEL